MTIREALVAKLAAESTVTDLVDDRVFPDRIPQAETLPAIAYQIPEEGLHNDLDGLRSQSTPLLRITAADRTHDAATEVRDAVKAVLADSEGQWGTLSIQAATAVDQSTVFVAPTDGSDKGYYLSSVDIRVLCG